MYAQREKPKENKSRAVANSVTQKKNSEKQGFGFVDNRPDSIVQIKPNTPIQMLKKGKLYSTVVKVTAWDQGFQAKHICNSLGNAKNKGKSRVKVGGINNGSIQTFMKKKELTDKLNASTASVRKGVKSALGF